MYPLIPSEKEASELVSELFEAYCETDYIEEPIISTVNNNTQSNTQSAEVTVQPVTNQDAELGTQLETTNQTQYINEVTINEQAFRYPGRIPPLK